MTTLVSSAAMLPKYPFPAAFHDKNQENRAHPVYNVNGMHARYVTPQKNQLVYVILGKTSSVGIVIAHPMNWKAPDTNVSRLKGHSH